MNRFMNRINYIPEEWRRISNYLPEVKDYYWISNKGIVYSQYSKKYNVYSISNVGYEQISLSLKMEKGNKRKTYTVHRLLMMCFNPISNPQNYQVNHMLGIKTINEIEVLEWCTNKENTEHAFDIGLAPVCEDRYNSVLTNEQVHLICTYLELGMPYKDICKKVLNIENPDRRILEVIKSIKSGANWRNISSLYNIDYHKNYRQIFNNNQTKIVFNCCNIGMDNESIILSLGYNLKELPIEVINKLNNDINSIRNGFGYRELIKKLI